MLESGSSRKNISDELNDIGTQQTVYVAYDIHIVVKTVLISLN